MYIQNIGKKSIYKSETFGKNTEFCINIEKHFGDTFKSTHFSIYTTLKKNQFIEVKDQGGNYTEFWINIETY